MVRADRSRSSGEGSPPPSLPQTTPPEYGHSGHDFTLQAIIGLERSVAVLGEKIDRLVEDRKEDRQEVKDGLKEIKADLKEFRQGEFKQLSDDVTKLRVSWAKVVGGAAIVGALVSFAAEILKSKLGG